ncbi:MAG: WXG100 family type VII secretion target [Actinomadura sp.]
MSELWVEPEGLKRSAKGFTEGSRGLTQTQEQLAADLAAEGRCWGADETGEQFEADYLSTSQDVLKAFGELAKGLSAIKAGLDEMAKNYEVAEDGSTGAVNSVGRKV